MQQVLVPFDDHPVAFSVALDLDIVRTIGMRGGKARRAACYRREIDGLAPRDTNAREVQKLRQESRQPIRLAHDEPSERPLVGVGASGARELLDGTPDRRERV